MPTEASPSNRLYDLLSQLLEEGFPPHEVHSVVEESINDWENRLVHLMIAEEKQPFVSEEITLASEGELR